MILFYVYLAGAKWKKYLKLGKTKIQVTKIKVSLYKLWTFSGNI
jgi:hypothetical protein